MFPVTAFTRDGSEHAHFTFRLTKAGRVNLTDVNRFLGLRWKVPPRYTSGGIRRVNRTDVEWPEDVLFKGDPPEEFPFRGEELAAFREKLVQHHPSKFTPEERARIGVLELRLTRAEDPDALAERQALLDALAKRPFTGDEW